MRILYINHYAGSPAHGMEYRPHYMARHWTRMGHEVMVVAASESHLRHTPPALSGEVTEETIDGVRYLWVKTPPYAGNGARRAINMAAFVRKLYRLQRRLAEGFHPDAVIASSTYTWDIFPAHAIARRAGARLIYEVHDLWPLSPIELGGMSRWHPFIMALQYGENYACRHADMVVSILPFADRHLRLHGMAPEKYHHIPNGIELPEWMAAADALPEAHRNAIAEARRRQRFLIGYAGDHGLSNALDNLLNAARLLTAHPVDFMLVGGGFDKLALQQRAKDLGLHNVAFLDPIPKNAIPEFLRCMDGLFIGWKKQSLYRFGISPNKVMDYMAAGKPIISAADSANDPIADAHCGFSVPPEQPQAIADAVLQLMNLSPEERACMGKAGEKFVQAHHDYAVLSKKFFSVMSTRSDYEFEQ